MKLTIEEIFDNPEKNIKCMCYNLLISVDSQVFNLSSQPMRERLIGGSYCYYCNGRYRTKSWIRCNSSIVLGMVTY